MDLAQAYGTKLYTGVLYRNPDPSPTYEGAVRKRHEEMSKTAKPKAQILSLFAPH
jgi:2-oxoglutarate ferredoxin oxidoreductase subunit beta